MRFSKKPQFNLVPPNSIISECAWRLIAFDDNHNILASGTCIVIAGNLALTAKHLIEDYINHYGVSPEKNPLVTNVNCHLWFIQILQDDNEPYAIWESENIWLCPHSDLALIHLRPYCENSVKYRSQGFKQPKINLFPPALGSRVVGFGYHSSTVMVSQNPDNTPHWDLKDIPTATVGEIIEIHDKERDKVKLNFPCYRVNCRFDGGMSGGPVFNDDGELCGIICTGMKLSESEEEHISYVSTLWPLMGTTINAGRGDRYPRDVPYPVIELVRDNIIIAKGWHRVLVDPNGGISLKGKLNP